MCCFSLSERQEESQLLCSLLYIWTSRVPHVDWVESLLGVAWWLGVVLAMVPVKVMIRRKQDAWTIKNTFKVKGELHQFYTSVCFQFGACSSICEKSCAEVVAGPEGAVCSFSVLVHISFWFVGHCVMFCTERSISVEAVPVMSCETSECQKSQEETEATERNLQLLKRNWFSRVFPPISSLLQDLGHCVGAAEWMEEEENRYWI